MLRRLALRFTLIAFALYHLPLVPNAFPTLGGGGAQPDGVSAAWGAIYGQLGLWVARHVFGLTGDMPDALSGDNGDTTAEYCRVLVSVVIAAIAALAWTWADRKRPRAAWVEPALRVLLRYAIAIGLASYAMQKIFPVQFVPIWNSGLEMRVGELTPRRMLWNFMSTSRPYNFIAGMMELGVVVLLAFRRTATLGALLCLPVLANVALMNFCYDVPVKLFSTSLVVAASLLVALDAPRILAALGFASTLPPPPVAYPRRWTWAGWGAKCVLIGGALLSSAVDSARVAGGNAGEPPLSGIWRVQGAADWQRLAVDDGRVAIRFADDRLVRCPSKLDAQQLALTCSEALAGTLRWQLAGDTLRLDGSFGGQPLALTLVRVPTSLMHTPFRWTID